MSHHFSCVAGSHVPMHRSSSSAAHLYTALICEVRHWSQVTCSDATKWHHSEPRAYDKVLVDAPCSSDRHLILQRGGAESVLRRDWSPARLKRDASLQIGLLESALASTRPGGRVVYSTCSLSQTQNDDVVSKALRRRGGTVDFEAASLPCALVPGVERTDYGFIALPDSTEHGPIFWSAIRVEGRES
jgi:16S rRNA C967 or C1407 C5-methylase (RsmB/RsmF family)